MPQTEEEHLELENDDDDKSETERNLDAEVGFIISLVFNFPEKISYRFNYY